MSRVFIHLPVIYKANIIETNNVDVIQHRKLDEDPIKVPIKNNILFSLEFLQEL